MKEVLHIDSSVGENDIEIKDNPTISTTSEEVTGNEDNPTKGVEDFLNQFDSRLDQVSPFLDKLSDNNLSSEERMKILDQVIDYMEEFGDFVSKFMEEKRDLLEKKHSYQCFYVCDRIHELKTQAGGIIGFVYLVKEDGLSHEDFDDHISAIKTGISGVKLMSKNLKNTDLENPEIKLSYFYISKLIEELSEKYSKVAKTKNITIDTNIEPDILISTCEGIVNSAIINILNNAIKFTKEGGKVSVSCRKDNDDNLIIEIKDDGVGISEDRQKELFTKIVQTSKGTGGEMGTGVGLYVNYNEIKKIGGDLRVESKGEGQGTTFTITLPELKQ